MVWQADVKILVLTVVLQPSSDRAKEWDYATSALSHRVNKRHMQN